MNRYPQDFEMALYDRAKNRVTDWIPVAREFRARWEQDGQPVRFVGVRAFEFFQWFEVRLNMIGDRSITIVLDERHLDETRDGYVV